VTSSSRAFSGATTTTVSALLDGVNLSGPPDVQYQEMGRFAGIEFCFSFDEIVINTTGSFLPSMTSVLNPRLKPSSNPGSYPGSNPSQVVFR
jgi:hypothetical protein